MPGVRNPPTTSPVEAPAGLRDARGGRRERVPVTVEVLRELGPEDLPALAGRQAAPAPGQALRAIKHSHHQLAKLVAKGHGVTDISLITGYDVAYISNIKNNDPTFRELVSHYAGVVEEAFVDVMERLKVLGLNSIDELQQRLETDPDAWSRRELMELAELTLLKPLAAIRGGNLPVTGGSSGPGVNVQVNFVTAQHPQALVDVTPAKSHD